MKRKRGDEEKSKRKKSKRNKPRRNASSQCNDEQNLAKHYENRVISFRALWRIVKTKIKFSSSFEPCSSLLDDAVALGQDVFRIGEADFSGPRFSFSLSLVSLRWSVSLSFPFLFANLSMTFF
jgi:hypothetical protein